MINWLIARLESDYPDLKFKLGKKFSFRPPRTVYYEQNCEEGELILLHEVGHALLGHHDFLYDIERLKMERAAWECAAELAEKYGLVMDEELIEKKLDSYRDWLHQRSQCAKCGSTCYQDASGKYICTVCDLINRLA